jgi:hypothetical protein
MADQGPEEFLPGAAGSPFDHRLEGAKVVVHGRDDRRLARAGRRRARFLTQGPSGVLLIGPVRRHELRTEGFGLKWRRMRDRRDLDARAILTVS